jgi:hypothetical protein
MKYIVLFIFVSSLFGCSTHEDKDIIDQDKFVDILADIHIADAVIVVKGLRINSDSAQIKALYNDVFLKYNITQKQLDKTFEFYSKKPIKLDRLYNRVSEKIVKMEDSYKEKKEE